MLPNPDSNITALHRDLDWVCRLYTEEVWAFLYPDYRPRIAPNHRFMEQVEESRKGGKAAYQFRLEYAQVVKAYARSGIKFSWNVDPTYRPMFEAYQARHGTSDAMKTTARLINMEELFEYVQEWVGEAAYYEWEREGRPDGRAEEHWGRAMRSFLEEHRGCP